MTLSYRKSNRRFNPKRIFKSGKGYEKVNNLIPAAHDRILSLLLQGLYIILEDEKEGHLYFTC